MAEKEAWYRKSYRRCLVDMHIPDWNSEFFAKFDSQKYIDAMKRAGVDTAYFYCDSCTGICNWPTKTGHMHAGLQGRDIVRELSEGLKAEGINVIAYINIWSRWAAMEHPDWQCVDEDGRPTLDFQWGQPGRYGECCMNSPYRDYVLKLVRELCEDYDFIGLWVDMILWRIMCYCPHCQKRFFDETGMKLPEKVDWHDPAWRTWLKKREEWNAEFLQDIIRTAREYKPDLTVMCNSSYLPNYFMGESLKFFRLGEFIGGDFLMERHAHSYECKLFNSVSAHKPFEFLGSVMDPSLYEHSIVKSPEHLRSLMGSTLLNNGRYGFIDAIDPSGTLNPRVYDRMHDIYEFERQYEPYLRPDAEFVCDVGLYTNLESYINMDANGERVNQSSPKSRHQENQYAMATLLIENHIPFAVLTQYDLERLNDFRVLVLDSLSVLTPQEIEALTVFVKNGGCLYVEGETARYDTDCEPISGGGLKEVLGAESDGYIGKKTTYIRPCSGQEDLLCGYDAEHPLSVPDSQLKLISHGAKTLAKVTLPWVDPDDKTKFASAISDPPGNHTEYPAVLYHEYGAGRVVWSAAEFEYMRKPDQTRVFCNLMGLLTGGRYAIETDAPRCVELSLYRQKEDDRYILNLLNFPAELPSVTAHGIHVTLNVPETVKRVRILPSGREMDYERLPDGRIRFTAEPLEIFDMYSVEYGE